MKILIVLAVICTCSADQTDPRSESTAYSEQENEEINNVYGNLHLDKVKTIPYSEHKTKATEESSTDTMTSTQPSQKRNPDKSIATPSSVADDKTETWQNKHLGNAQNEEELLGSATGTRKQIGKQDSHISDIPADDVVPLSTGDYNSESNTAPTDKDFTFGVNSESSTISGIGSQTEEGTMSSESPISSTNSPKTTSESYVQQEETSKQPTKTSQVTISPENSGKRKTPGVAYVTTEKVPHKDTPVFPIFPDTPVYPIFPTSPPIRKGQLDIKISIPNFFHLSLGDTPDGRRRLGILAPFFRFDLTKPRLLKVFHK